MISRVGDTDGDDEDSQPDGMLMDFDVCIMTGSLPEVQKHLLAGADVHGDLDGETTLTLAAVGGKRDVVRELMDANACVNAKNHLGRTPLHIASMYGHTEVVQELCSCEELRPNLVAENKMTALHVAAAKGHIDVVTQLLAHNADVTAAMRPPGKPSMTPADLAQVNRHRDIKDLLHRAPRIAIDNAVQGLMRNEVEELELAHSGIGDDGFVELGHSLTIATKLRHLNFRNCHISDRGVKLLCNALAHNPSVQTINLADNPDITDMAALYIVNTLEKQKRIERIGLMGTGMSISAVSEIKAITRRHMCTWQVINRQNSQALASTSEEASASSGASQAQTLASSNSASSTNASSNSAQHPPRLPDQEPHQHGHAIAVNKDHKNLRLSYKNLLESNYKGTKKPNAPHPSMNAAPKASRKLSVAGSMLQASAKFKSMKNKSMENTSIGQIQEHGT